MAIGCTGNDPAARGPYRVGVRVVEVVDTGRDDRHLRTEIWYPTNDRTSLPAPRYASGIHNGAIADAAPARGPFPWIVFSHGLSAVREQSTFLTEHLASHGYVVVAPDHENNTGRDFHLFGVFRSALDRPMDLRVVMDHVLALSRDPRDPLFGRLCPCRGAAMGQSLGGYTALAVGGAWVDVDDFPKSLSGADGSGYYDFRDPRIRAVVAMAPIYQPGFDALGLSRLRVPTLVMGGTRDFVTPVEKNARPVFEQAGGVRYLAIIRGATHFNFNNEEMLATAPFFIRGLHHPTIDRQRSDRIVCGITLAFLERHLRNCDAFADALEAPAPEVELESLGVTPSACRIGARP